MCVCVCVCACVCVCVCVCLVCKLTLNYRTRWCLYDVGNSLVINVVTRSALKHFLFSLLKRES